MKALSLWQPWASLLAHGIKRVETRSWHTDYRGPVLIHAALSVKSLHLCPTEPFRSALAPPSPIGATTCGDLPRGSLLGSARLVDIWPVAECVGISDAFPHDNGTVDPRNRLLISDTENKFGDYTFGRFAWLFDDFKPFTTPIPYRGFQQLFNVPDDVFAEAVAA